MKRHESQTHGQMLQSLDEDMSRDMGTKTNVVIGNREITKDLLTRALDAHGGLSRWLEIAEAMDPISYDGHLNCLSLDRPRRDIWPRLKER